MRGRGRPPQRASDIQLVWLVGNALDRNPRLTVEKACEQMVRAGLLKAATIEQLVRRYHRVATAYPDRFVEIDGASRRCPAFVKAALARSKGKIRLPPGAAILTVDPVRKPSK